MRVQISTFWGVCLRDSVRTNDQSFLFRTGAIAALVRLASSLHPRECDDESYDIIYDIYIYIINIL